MSFAEVSLEVFSVWHAGFSGQMLWGRGPHASRFGGSFLRELSSFAVKGGGTKRRES